jgi:hypothetical protein
MTTASILAAHVNDVKRLPQCDNEPVRNGFHVTGLQQISRADDGRPRT